jgi:hypothetical protein
VAVCTHRRPATDPCRPRHSARPQAICAFLVPRRFWIALLAVGACFTSHFSYLFGKVPVPLPVAAVMLGTASICLTFDLLRALYPASFGALEPPAR